MLWPFFICAPQPESQLEVDGVDAIHFLRSTSLTFSITYYFMKYYVKAGYSTHAVDLEVLHVLLSNVHVQKFKVSK